jgi:hypothetical protein
MKKRAETPFIKWMNAISFEKKEGFPLHQADEEGILFCYTIKMLFIL